MMPLQLIAMLSLPNLYLSNLCQQYQCYISQHATHATLRNSIYRSRDSAQLVTHTETMYHGALADLLHMS